MEISSKNMNPWLRSDRAAAWWGILLVRIMVGTVFVSEGFQKFAFPEIRGPGRFERIGFPAPEVLGYSVGAVELFCGGLILVGLATRMAAIPLLVIMLGAILTTKLPILLGQDLGPFQVRDVALYGFWGMAHEMRNDWAMVLGSLFLLLTGGGPWALDRILERGEGRPSPAPEPPARREEEEPREPEREPARIGRGARQPERRLTRPGKRPTPFRVPPTRPERPEDRPSPPQERPRGPEGRPGRAEDRPAGPDDPSPRPEDRAGEAEPRRSRSEGEEEARADDRRDDEGNGKHSAEPPTRG